ncbi:MAG: pyridoxamine 5'-phosphate oxidase family protein [Acidimicrobiia bacterium]
MTAGWQDDDRVVEVLDEAGVLWVAVASRRGPHVTPAVFDVDGRRLWFVTPRRSVKARAIDRHRRVGALATFGDRAVMMSGRARIVDPLTARVSSLGRLLDLPLAAAGYLGRNHRHATGTVRDHKAPTLALSRVAVSIDVTRLALLEGEAVLSAWGRWDDQDLLLQGPVPDGGPPDLGPVPARIRTLLLDAAPVVVGWQSFSGPLAVPARWRAGRGVAETSAQALVLAGAGTAGSACLTAERSRHRLKHKEGILLRGAARTRRHGGVAEVAITPERVTWWVGEETRTFRPGVP